MGDNGEVQIPGFTIERELGRGAMGVVYHGHDPFDPNVGELNEKLAEFARQNLDIGVFLYLIISRELYDVGNRDAAEQILRRGVKVYSTHHSHIGRIKLINELFDQQLGK